MNSQLENLRRRIDRLDRKLLLTLASRMEVSDEIGRGRRHNSAPALRINRMREILASRTDEGRRMKLPPKFVSKIFWIIHEESVRRQTKIIGSKAAPRRGLHRTGHS